LPDINERKKRILHAVIANYIITAEPVGSRTVARSENIGLSSATIRNEMSDLEEMGYLEQPHTSAGRIPTEMGYRYYVDHLMGSVQIGEDDKQAIKAFLNEKMREIEQIILNATRTLSSVTSYTSLIMGPQFKRSAFQQMRILPLDERRGLVVMITDTGFIKNRVINLPRNLSPAELNQVVSYLNNKLYGLTIDQVTTSLINELKRDLFRRLEILEQAFYLIEESLKEEEQVRVFLGGTTNILNQPEFKDVDKIRRLLALFEQENKLCSLLEQYQTEKEDDVVVRIGSENELEDIRECTLVTASYKINDKTLGTVGVLGPTRMDYKRVIGVIRYLVRNLNRLLSS
jgi:heat-inducible transcriptional repressor